MDGTVGDERVVGEVPGEPSGAVDATSASTDPTSTMEAIGSWIASAPAAYAPAVPADGSDDPSPSEFSDAAHRETSGVSAMALDPGIVSTESAGLIPQLPGDPDKYFNGVGEWVRMEQTLPDPRRLQAAIDLANKVYDESYTDDQADPLLNSYRVTQGAKDSYKPSIDAAQKVVDEFGVNYFSQNDYDGAQAELEAAMGLFEASGTEAVPDLDAFNALKARVEAVNGATVDSVDGKELTFGTKWVTAEQRAAANGALATASETVVKATDYYGSAEDRRQSKIDGACATLTGATETYEGQVIMAKPDYSGVDAAIDAANLAKRDVVVSPDGDGLGMGVYYVTDQAYIDEFDAKIERATASRDAATTQQQLDDAEARMKEGTADFLLLVLRTFDWDNIPEDFNWADLPYNSIPASYDWSKFPWDRADWTAMNYDGFPWDDNLAFVKAAVANGMSRIAESADCMDAIFKSIIAKRELMASDEGIADAGQSTSSIGIGKIIAEMIGEDPLETTDMSTLAAKAETMEKIFADERALAAMVASPSAMTAVAASQVAMTAVAASQVAMTAVAASQVAMTAVGSVKSAMTTIMGSEYKETWWGSSHSVGLGLDTYAGINNSTLKGLQSITNVAANSTAMNAVAASSTAMNAVAASSTAMNAVAASTIAATAIESSSTAVNAIKSISSKITTVTHNLGSGNNGPYTMYSGVCFVISCVITGGADECYIQATHSYNSTTMKLDTDGDGGNVYPNLFCKDIICVKTMINYTYNYSVTLFKI